VEKRVYKFRNPLDLEKLSPGSAYSSHDPKQGSATENAVCVQSVMNFYDIIMPLNISATR